ncbi:MAG: M20/M25/M40 family metallo-hydrolase [Phycisphaerales bacterium]|nr:M20/M25/M40 family metallo-hydrolase [Phycisphaerales bacterium]
MPLDATEQRLAAALAARRDALLADLRTHVNLPTGGSHAPAMDESVRLLTDRLTALGASTRSVVGPNPPSWLSPDAATRAPRRVVVCSRPNTKARCRVLVSGHVDTVHEPDSPFRSLAVAPDGKTATGPGCVDMKGGLVIAVHALETLQEVGVDASWSFVLSTDEETGSFAADATLREEAAKHDVGLALEPATPEGGLVVERPGSGQFMIEAAGKAAHVGRDFKSGVNAIVAVARTVAPIQSLAKPDEGLIVNVGVIEGGTATNVVPDHARAYGNIRCTTPEIGRRAMAEIEAIVSGGTVPPGASLTFSSTLNRPAKPATPKVMALAGLAKAAAEDLGQSLPFSKTGGVCEGNNLQDAGLPTIDTLGVRGGGLHTPQEWIELASLVERSQLLAILIARLSRNGFSA